MVQGGREGRGERGEERGERGEGKGRGRYGAEILTRVRYSQPTSDKAISWQCWGYSWFLGGGWEC